MPPPPVYTETRENGLLIQRNVPVQMRDGVRIFIDIYWPADIRTDHSLPALLGWSPYGKHNTSDRLPWPAAGVAPRMDFELHGIQAPDPMFWCRHGFAVIYPDPRGAWYSKVELRHGGIGEAGALLRPHSMASAGNCGAMAEWV